MKITKQRLKEIIKEEMSFQQRVRSDLNRPAAAPTSRDGHGIDYSDDAVANAIEQNATTTQSNSERIATIEKYLEGIPGYQQSKGKLK
jgi:hypothetical protein